MKPPLSKSDAQRALVLADILGVPFEQVLPSGEVLPRDVEVLRDGLHALSLRSGPKPLGATALGEERGRGEGRRIDCHDGGAPFRFLLTQAAVQPGLRVEFTGTRRLGERPHAPLLQTLRTIPGIKITEGAPWPIVVESPESITGPIELSVTGVESSQFASSLLLGAARLAARGVKASVRVEGAMTSEGYFALTRSWLERTGFEVQQQGLTLTPTLLMRSLKSPSGLRRPSPLAGPRREREADFTIPGDWSSLGYLLALSWVSEARVERIAFGTGHPDEAIVAILEGVGLKISDRLHGTATGGLDVDCELCPDSIPTLAALATKLPAPSTFRRTGILRHKESDRLAGIRELIAATSLAGDTLTVRPGPVSAIRFDAHDDHRLAMSAAVLARLHDVKLTLRGMNCVAKSFPAFWEEAARAGLQVEEWR